VWGRNHGGDDNAIPREVAKSFKPTRAIILERIPLEKGRVKSVSVIYKFLEIFQGNLGSEGRPPQILEKAIKAIGPETNDDVVLVGYIAQRGRNASRQRDLQKVEHHFG
jgi:hypothetical protein